MALIRCDFYSDALGVATSMTVLLPEVTATQIGTVSASSGALSRMAGGFPTLYLLHGLSDNSSAWTRQTSIERYVTASGLAVVMPEVSRSFYTDEAYGLDYWTFLSEELPAKVESLFRVSTERSERFVAGLSMGGYGAMKWALRQPDRFAAVASLSGALDIERIQSAGRRPDDPRMMERLFGETIAAGTDVDLFALLPKVVDPPAVYLACGTDDVLIKDNLKFENACAAVGIDVTTNFGPGRHNWPYWDERIRDVLDWLPIPKVED